MTDDINRVWLKNYSTWTDPELEYGDTTLLDIYANNVARGRDRHALWFMGRTTTVGELDDQVRSFAAGLRAFGVKEGDNVVIALPNCPQHVIAFYAVLMLGARVVEHNPLYTARELHDPFLNHGARVAVVWDKRADVFNDLRHGTALETIIAVNMINALPSIKQFALKLPFAKARDARDKLHSPAPGTVPFSSVVGEEIGGLGVGLTAPETITKESPAVIMYTSGTTGVPKGAVLTHGSLYSNLIMGKAWVKDLGKRKERLLAALPFFHAYGLTMALTLAFDLGGELVLVPTPQPDLIMDAFKARRPTWFSGVPLLFEKVMDAAEKNHVSLKSVRSAFCGAASLPPDIIAKWESRTSGLMVEGYGLTETSPIVIGTPLNPSRKQGFIGLPFPDTVVRIANPNDLDETVPYGEEGEILVKGPQVFVGYLNNPEATAQAFHNGWFRTGDVGVMDEDGFVKLVSRIKEVIITGGFNVHPGEVESALVEHPDIEAACAVGRPRHDGSEDVVACVVLRDGAALDPEGFKEFARERLTRYKVPRTFYAFEELPTNIMGKISRREIQEQLLKSLEK